MSSADSNPNSPGRQFCGTTEVARILGLSVGTIQTLVERQELQAWKTRGGHRRISLASVHEYQRRNHSAALGSTSGNNRIMWVQVKGPQQQKLVQNLARWGISLQVDWCENMVEALLGLQNLRPGLVVMDLKSPPTEALQFIRHVHASAEFRMLTLLVLSTARIPEDVLTPAQGARVHSTRRPLDWSWLRGYLEAYQMLQLRQPMH